MATRRGSASALLALLMCIGLAACESKPAPEQPKTTDARSVHFTAAGDTGVEEGAEAVLDKIKELSPDFNLHLGDMSYSNVPEQQFCDMVTGKLGKDFPYQLLAGNHESDGLQGDIEKFAECLPNKLPGLKGEYAKQWYVDMPQERPLVRVIMLSPGIPFEGGDELDYSEGSERWKWTENAINSAHEAKIPWTVVGMHTPCFSIGRYSCDAGRELTNMLVKKKVDLVLNGHEHIYQRTKQLATSVSCREMEARKGCMADTDDSLDKGKGTVFVTSGLGGRNIRPINHGDEEKPYFAAWSGSNEDPAMGTVDVRVTGSRMDVKFVPADGYTFTDSFSISR
ncbi:hypothetical protein QFZ60_000728 [Arthrobacter sp. B2I5]|uniref:metallophosphoesterase n=1 Tax=Arthrobacter sp. B2I5 TaxID=3042266 RepID=UPI00278B8482|nr:metallophosphoesterase [Arthrobacter sp. B2I5]MDQ0824555.1 hypothetical protein [Arthrobacter sp. B2I5]